MLRLLAFLFTINCLAQDFADGLVVVEFNASFNKTNEVQWLSKLTDCEVERIDIAADSRWASQYKIVVVPTLVVFNNNEEAKRFQANIMMTMEATRKEVQDSIDEITMEAF
tara:strand:- start:3612 stop:3944 length:333 start_codon:yes stop_codon:yes gene_type:complete